MTSTQESKINQFIGKKIRATRNKLGVSQEKLGEEIICSAQQVQKYETNLNRISAAKVYILSKAMNVPIQFFFPVVSNQHQEPEPPKTVTLIRLLNRVPGRYYDDLIVLLRAFVRITNKAASEPENDE